MQLKVYDRLCILMVLPNPNYHPSSRWVQRYRALDDIIPCWIYLKSDRLNPSSCPIKSFFVLKPSEPGIHKANRYYWRSGNIDDSAHS